MTEQQTASPAGWHPDPGDPAFLRWWDGTTWTDQRQPRPPDASVPSTEEEGSGMAVAGFVLAILLPFIGFLVGLAMIAGRRRYGGWVVLTSVVVFFLWLAIVTG